MMRNTTIALAVTLLVGSVVGPGDAGAWSWLLHREVVRDAWYYMEHSPLATPNQRAAIQWMYETFPGINQPWNIVAEGAVWPDKVEHVCFKGLQHKKSFWGANFNSWYHFMDRYSDTQNYKHSRHGDCRNFASPDYRGEHNYIDGYNYRRHEELLADYDTDDIDSWAAWWIDDDNFCMEHGAAGLTLYEQRQGGRGVGGLLIASANNACYTRWHDDNPESDFWNLIFAPIDNVGRAYYQNAMFYRDALAAGNISGNPIASGFYKYLALHNLGASMHAADAAIFHHICQSTDWGHTSLEDWANNWYNDQEWFKNRQQQIKDFLDTYYTLDGTPAVDRPFRWLVHRLSDVVYTNEAVSQVWNRSVSASSNDARYQQYVAQAYPASVALGVVLIEKFYAGKKELYDVQAYGHTALETAPASNSNPRVKVVLTKMKCIDETNPEFLTDDDVYAKFTVEDGNRAANGRVPTSGDVQMSDGTVKTFNTTIFDASPIGDFLSIRVTVWNADPGSDSVIGRGELTFSQTQNWGRGGTYTVPCKYPDSDGHVDVYVRVD